jgi:hypothetical protein
MHKGWTCPELALLTPSPHHLRTVGPKTGAVLCVELELERRGTKYQFAALAEGPGQRPFLGIYVPRNSFGVANGRPKRQPHR